MSLFARTASARHYDPQGEVNVSGFAGSLVAFVSVTAAAAVTARLRGATLPERYPLADIALGGLAAHKFSRLLAKGSVTSPIRAPFTEFRAPTGSSEHLESPRGHRGGVRHTVGELLTCPFCIGTWVSAAYVGGLTVSPRTARAWAAVFAVSGISDGLQHGYARLRREE